MHANDMKVSVIIPIYKVERYIRRCADSLLKQTIPDVEFIFVNDCTPDNSIEILKETIQEYPNRQEQIKIIHHTENRGLPTARNTGLAVATGEYIYHCDSDDFIEKNALEEMYLTAKDKDADIVWCDWYLSYGQSERYMKQPEFPSASEALDAILCGKMKYNVWNKLVRRRLYTDNSVTFPDGHGMGEDMTMIHLFACAKKIAYMPQAFYHYVKLNESAFCQSYSNRHLEDLQYNTARTIRFLTERFGHEKDKQIAFFKLEVKFPFLISDKSRDYRIWKEWFPEANEYIGQNRNISKRALFLQRAAKGNRYWLVKLYYIIVYRIIYKLIYK